MRPTAACIVAALLAAITISMAIEMGVVGNDFSIFWRSAHSPVASIYNSGSVNPFPYPPTTILWLRPLSVLPAWFGYLLWTVAWVAGFAALVFHMDGQRTTILAVLSPASIYCVSMGQMSGFVAILILAGAVAERGIWLGIALGLAATIKPQMLLLAPVVLIIRGDWKAFFGAMLVAALVVLVAVALFGLRPWFDWVAMLHEWRNVVRSTGSNAPAASPALFAEYLGLPKSPFLIAGVIVGLFLALSSKNSQPIELAAIIVLSSVIASPYAMVYDLMPVMPLAASRAFRSKAYLFLLFLPGGIIASLWVAALTVWRARCWRRITP
jgi:hypothetical protein